MFSVKMFIMLLLKYKIGDKMKTEAEKKAQKKYQNKVRTTTKAQLNCTIDREDFNLISNYCSDNEISKASLVVNAIKYCIENNIDLKNKD